MAKQLSRIEQIVVCATVSHMLVQANPDRRKGSFTCPVCDGGTVHWNIASNDHSRGACNTKGCVQWIQ